MNNTKEFIVYNVCIQPEFINTSVSSHKTYSEAKQSIADKLTEIANDSNMRADNKVYWSEKYTNAIIVEYVGKYTVV
jgi:hypothetical protein